MSESQAQQAAGPKRFTELDYGAFAPNLKVEDPINLCCAHDREGNLKPDLNKAAAEARRIKALSATERDTLIKSVRRGN